jgi:hypothetical protein
MSERTAPQARRAQPARTLRLGMPRSAGPRCLLSYKRAALLNPAACSNRGGIFLWAPRWGVEHFEQGARFKSLGLTSR